MDFLPAYCHCGAAVGEFACHGMARIICPNPKCRRRVHIASDGEHVVVTLIDKRPRRLHNGARSVRAASL
jgi:hypothetical protein